MNEENSQLNEQKIEALVKKSQKGDSQAYAKIYDEFIKPIYRYVFYKVNNEDVEDLVEMLFLKAWENIDKYKKRKNKSFRAWLFRIAHNLVIDHYRISRTHSSLDFHIEDTKKEANPIQMTKESLNNERLRIALKKLKPNYQQIIILKFINELSNDEISKIIKKNEGTVRILQFRALKALKVELENMGISEY